MITTPPLGAPHVEMVVEVSLDDAALRVGAVSGQDAISHASAPAAGSPSLLEAAQHEPSTGAAAQATGDGTALTTRSLELTLATFAAQNAGPAAAALGNSALARLLASAALGHAGAAAGLSRPAAAALTMAASLLRAAGESASPAVVAALLGDLANAIERDAPELARAALPPQPAQQSVNVIPPWDPSAKLGRADTDPATVRANVPADEARSPVAFPDCDARGRRYDARERVRLARLAADPRHGYAPEGRIALAAETEHGLRLERAPDASHDFTDAVGGRWNTHAPPSIGGLEAALADDPPGVHAIVSAAALDDGGRAALGALVRRLATRPGAARVLIVDGGER